MQIAYMLPLALLGPLSGVFVDRWPLKPTLVASDLIRAGARAAAVRRRRRCGRSTWCWRAQLRVELLRPGAVGDDPQPRAAARPDLGQRADADGDDGHAASSVRRRPARWSRPSGRASATPSISSASSCRPALIGSVAIIRPPSPPRAPAGIDQQQGPRDPARDGRGDALHRAPRGDLVRGDGDGGRHVRDGLLRTADRDLRARLAARQGRRLRDRQRDGRASA